MRTLFIFLLLAATLQAQQPVPKSIQGSVTTMAQLSNRNTAFQVFPPNYIATEGRFGFTGLGMPLQATMRLNSAHQRGVHQLNAVTLEVDIARWKAGLQQKLLDKLQGKADSLGSENLLATLEQQRGKRIAEMHTKLESRYGGKLPEPDLSQFAEAKKKLPGLKSALKQELYSKATSKWQNWEDKLGADFESRMPKIRDSLIAVDPNSYDEFLHDRLIFQQYQKMQKRKQEFEAILKKKDELKPLIEDYTSMKELENLSMDQWIESMNPDESLKLIQQLDAGLLGELNGIIQRIESLQIGNTNPSYTASSLDAVIVNGVDAEVRFGKLMLGGTAGKIQPSPFIANGLPWSGAIQPGGKRVVGGKLGFGSEENGIQAFALDMNLPVEADSARVGGTVENRIIGLAGNLSLFKQKLTIGGDWQFAALKGGALLRDQRGLALNWEEPLEIDTEAGSQGICWNIEMEAEILKNLTLDGSYRSLSEGYVSLGTPFMSRSADRYRANLRYQMAKGKLVTTLFVRRDEDPATAFKPGRSLMTQYGASLLFRPSEKLPFIQLQYIPYSQSQQEEALTQQAKGSMIAGNMGYSYRINQFWLQTDVSATINTNQQFVQSASSQNILYTVRQQCQVGEHGGGAISYTNIGAEYSEDFQRTNALDFSAFMVLGKAFRTDVGLSLINEEGEQGVGRKSLYLISQIPLGKALIFDVRAERNILNNGGQGLPDVNEYLIRSGCTFNF